MNATTTPAGACDCHLHIYDPAYPFAATATFQPPPATVAAYRDVQRRLGLERALIVQPTGYGFDNRCTLDALAQMGATARAIVVISADTGEAELQRLHALGVRGVRFMMKIGAPGYDDVAALARALLAAHPDRCLWASNWPHPNRTPRPEDAAMLALLADWAPAARDREGILVHNAAAAYGFAPIAPG